MAALGNLFSSINFDFVCVLCVHVRQSAFFHVFSSSFSRPDFFFL